MEKQLRILHLEDDELDAGLVESRMIAEGLNAEIVRVDSSDAFNSAILQGGFDIIFADYSLPGFDGITAFQSARKVCPDVPFIFISGKMGEERAVEILKSGATDYILKDGMSRLVPAVRRALREAEERAERRRAVEALKRAHSDLVKSNCELREEIQSRIQAEQDLVKVERALRTLSRSNAAIVVAADELALAKDICRIITEEGKYLMAWIGYPHDNDEKTVRPVAFAGRENGYLTAIRVSWADNKWGQGPSGSAIRTGRVCIQNQRLNEPFMEPWRDEAAKRGFVSAIGLPLIGDGECFGSLTIYASQTDVFIDKESLLLKELADNVAFAIKSLRIREKNRNTEEEIRISRERLHGLAAHLQKVREDERTAIARDIHDELGQMLTALKFDLSRTLREARDKVPDLGEWIRKDLEIVDSVIQSVKKICTELRPSILDHLGLGPAIEWQAEEFQRRSAIQCKVTIDPENLEVMPDLAIVLFRILQESLTNVMRHSKATEVTIKLAKEDDGIKLEISDNGVGMTADQLQKANSFGIMGMRERVYPWNGTVGIVASLRDGTKIVVSIPAIDIKPDGS